MLLLSLVCFTTTFVMAQDNDINTIRQKAYSGDTDAMIELSRIYEKQGEKELSLKWLEKATKSGNQTAIAMSGNNEVDNAIHEKDPIKKFQVLYKYAEAGNVKAMIGLGDLYETGTAVAKNTEEAIKWYRKAYTIDERLLLNSLTIFSTEDASRLMMIEIANKGNTEAMIRLGETSSSDAEAHKWYKMAAAKGDRRGKQKSDELYAQRKAEQAAEEAAEEAAEGRRTLYRSTFRDMAGYWTCSNSYTQFWITSDGRAYFRNGSGYAWEELGVKYMDYYKIRVYDAHAVHYLKLKGNQLIQDDTYVYYRR